MRARPRPALRRVSSRSNLQTASSRFPNALLHFEDFGADNARRILVTYRDQYRIFNDDMQGTGVIAMAGLFGALKVTGTRWQDQRVVVFGGGTAGIGIADQIRDQMVRDGLDPSQGRPARSGSSTCPACSPTTWSTACWTTSVRTSALPPRPRTGRSRSVQIDPAASVRWPEMAALQQARAESGIIGLQTVVEKVKPTILIGTSTTHGAFTKQVVEAMSAGGR